MSTYAAIIVRQYAEGRICITTDRVGGYLSIDGGSLSLWRNLFEWTSQKSSFETIKVGVINSNQIPYRSKLESLAPISFQEITVNRITYGNISEFDVLYFIGLPPSESDLENTIEDYVKNGGGVYIEVPDQDGEIELLKEIESVSCYSSNRTLFTKAYWTPDGKQHYAYVEPVFVGFLSTLDVADFSSVWVPLMTNEQSVEEIIIPDVSIITNDKIGSEFGVGYTVAMQHGIVEIDIDMSTSSSSSLDSSSSSSSSSAEEDTSWDFCEDIVAYWKMDENFNSPIVWDESHDFQHMGLYKKSAIDSYTSTYHVNGVVNGALSFNGTDTNIQTTSNKSLNFRGGVNDDPFTVNLWIYPISKDGYVLCKSGVWEIYLLNSTIYMQFHSPSGYRIYNLVDQIPLDRWSNITFAYSGLFSGMSIYFNGGLQSQVKSQAGYTIMNDLNSPIYFASGPSSNFFNGYIDNVIVLDKKINEIEAEVLWNIGRGNDQCSGIYRYSSSSSSSTSSSSNSSSSSIDSSSSSSSSSIDSSSSSSSSSIDSSSSSSTSSSSSESQS